MLFDKIITLKHKLSALELKILSEIKNKEDYNFREIVGEHFLGE